MTSDTTDTTDTTDTIESARKKKDNIIYHFVIGDHLFEKIKKHVRLLKYIDDQGQTKKQWIAEAIERKINKEESLPPDDLVERRFLSTAVSEDLDKRLRKRVALYKKIRKNYSRKQLILEAVHERLDSDEPLLKEQIKDFVSKEIDIV